jgi:hypothetical protein
MGILRVALAMTKRRMGEFQKTQMMNLNGGIQQQQWHKNGVIKSIPMG